MGAGNKNWNQEVNIFMNWKQELKMGAGNKN